MTKIGEGFVYKGRPVVSPALKDKVRKLRMKIPGETTVIAPVPESMKGKVARRGRGYSAKVNCLGKYYYGWIRQTPEEAYADRPALVERMAQMAPLKAAQDKRR